MPAKPTITVAHMDNPPRLQLVVPGRGFAAERAALSAGAAVAAALDMCDAWPRDRMPRVTITDGRFGLLLVLTVPAPRLREDAIADVLNAVRAEVGRVMHHTHRVA